MKAISAAALAAAVIMVHPAMAKRPRVGEPAPDATMVLVDGETVRLSDLRGQVVVMNFWATWCGPCKQELPLLDGYYRAARRYGLRVFAATTEDSVPERYLRALFDKLAIQPVHRLSGPYAPMEGVPTNYVIDRAGIVRYARSGAFDLDALNGLLLPLLREAGPKNAEVVAAN